MRPPGHFHAWWFVVTQMQPSAWLPAGKLDKATGTWPKLQPGFRVISH
jgi:hypothetical protein